MKYQLERIQQLRCSMDTAWKFFSSPYNLSRITPKTLNFVVLSNPDVNEIYEGMEINYTVSPFLGIPLKWKTRIVKVDQGQSFIDFQEKGPFKYWSHLHDFVPNEWGGLRKDTVNYELYGGLLGGAAHKLIVGKKLEQIFDYRYKVLEELFPIMIINMNLLIVLGVFFSMEGATWLIHKYVMHGFLWFLHRDHHDHSREGMLEKNDYFFVIFALPALALMYYGSNHDFNYMFFIGLGITLYGAAYFFVHDVFIHQRIPFLRNTKNPYLLGIRRAHKQHHKHTSKEKGECFGFLWVPVKYFKMYLNKKSA